MSFSYRPLVPGVTSGAGGGAGDGGKQERHRVKLVQEGHVLLFRVSQTRSFIGKIINSKYMRRWTPHQLLLSDDTLSSRWGGTYLNHPICLGDLREIGVVGCYDENPGFFIRLGVDHSVIVLQVGSKILQEQWFYSLEWKRRMYNLRESVLSEFLSLSCRVSSFKEMMRICLETPLNHEHVLQYPISVVSAFLSQNDLAGEPVLRDELILAMTPVLKHTCPPAVVCRLLSSVCLHCPDSQMVMQVILPVVIVVLKHNADFGRSVSARLLVQHFLEALTVKENCEALTDKVVSKIHGGANVCPHPRVAQNLIAVCLRAVFHHQQQADLASSGGESLLAPPSYDQASTPAVMTQLLTADPSPGGGDEGLCPSDSPQLSSHVERFVSSDSSCDSDADSQPKLDVTLLLPQSQSDEELVYDSGTGSNSELIRNDIVLGGRDLQKLSPHSGTDTSLFTDDEADTRKHSDSSYDCDSKYEVSSDGENENEIEVETDEVFSETDNAPSSGDKMIRQFLSIIRKMSQYFDWLPTVGNLLQSVPFSETTLTSHIMTHYLSDVVRAIGLDSRCGVHRCVMELRSGRSSWLQLVCPSQQTAPADSGQLWASILEVLLHCCCKRKSFIGELVKHLGACQLMAIRNNHTCQRILCLMLEWNLLAKEEERDMAITALLTTSSGRKMYKQLSEELQQLQCLQAEGGPEAVALPCRSTDGDLGRLLACGRLGNLHTLSLAFTNVTSQCAAHLIKLPALVSLSLWSTQFGDAGLLLISEHLLNLETLDLCETHVTDKSIASLKNMKKLRSLNLNSVRVRSATVTELTQQLPQLQQLDVRYTDAW